ncbi:hypothetical protein IL306_014174 [Fusarium sp. DS 682]|nr:hypothetical protein IL306_014174 [Fusarium sp. DS 682]
MMDGDGWHAGKKAKIAQLLYIILLHHRRRAHECTLSMEILLALIKPVGSVRSDLKVVIMSGTLDAQKFVRSFDSQKTIRLALRGQTHPVEISYLKYTVLAVFELALMTVKGIHEKEKDGDILVFQSADEVEEACTLLRKEMGNTDVLPFCALN